MKLIEMNRGQRMAMLVMLVALVAAVAAVAVTGHSDSSMATADSVEMARFKAEIDSARLDTVKPRRKPKAEKKPVEKKQAERREIRQF